MGQALLSCGEANPDIEIAAGIDVGDSLADVIAASDAVIEFQLSRDHPFGGRVVC